MRVLEAWPRLLHPLMRFITEEIWQRVAPLAAKAGDTVMLQLYPRAEPAKIDEAANADIERLKLLVPMAGLIDKDAELARLANQIGRIEGDLAKTQAHIDNPNFGEAPAAVQEQARQHFAQLRTELQALRDQSGRIAVL